VRFPKLLSFALLALTISACEKSADLGRMSDETLMIVKLHTMEVENLQRRANALMVRGGALNGEGGADLNNASARLSEARAGIDQLRAQISTAGATMATAVKTNDVDEVQHASDELIEKLDDGEITVRASLAAVDNWLMGVENRPMKATPPPVVPPPPTPVPETPVQPAGGAAGSAAPKP